MKLSDVKMVDAIDVSAELMEPLALIAMSEKMEEAKKKFADEAKKANEVKDETKSKKAKVLAKVHFAQNILRACPEEIIKVFAILDRTPVEEYEFTLASIPQKIVELMNDPYILQLFGLQSENQTSSGSATVNTEVAEN